MSEEWRPIVGQEGRYEVSNLGRVRSVGGEVPYRRWKADGVKRIASRVRKPFFDEHGYASLIVVGTDGQRICLHVSSEVLTAFVGPRPEGMQACHNDGTPSNNTLSNLRWDTPAGNNADKVLHGTAQKGSRNGASKLIEAQVVDIKRRLPHTTLKALADEFGVSINTIWLIKAGRKWTHLEP